MPRLPFKIKKPGSPTTQVTTAAAAPTLYDSSRVYIHMGSSMKASENAQMALLRLSQMLEDATETKEMRLSC